jgi:hypothetical protein
VTLPDRAVMLSADVRVQGVVEGEKVVPDRLVGRGCAEPCLLRTCAHKTIQLRGSARSDCEWSPGAKCGETDGRGSRIHLVGVGVYRWFRDA